MNQVSIESIKVSDLENLAKDIATQRELCDQAAAAKKELDKELERLENKMIEVLNALDKSSYDAEVGKFIISHRTSVRVPSNPEDKALFVEYLKQKGIADQMLTVHSATLRSFYQSEFDAAKERGDLDFTIPGLGEPTITETLSFIKSRN